MATIHEQMIEQGYTGTGHKDWAIRKLAEWEDLLEKGDGSIGEAFPTMSDEMAMVRQALMEPHASGLDKMPTEHPKNPTARQFYNLLASSVDEDLVAIAEYLGPSQIAMDLLTTLREIRGHM